MLDRIWSDTLLGSLQWLIGVMSSPVPGHCALVGDQDRENITKTAGQEDCGAQVLSGWDQILHRRPIWNPREGV